MQARETNLKGDLGGDGIASIVWATVTIGASSFSSSATSTTSSETAAGACQNNFLLAKTVNFVNFVNPSTPSDPHCASCRRRNDCKQVEGHLVLLCLSRLPTNV